MLARLDAHELRHNRTESAIQSIYELLNDMRVWMDRHSAATEARFDAMDRRFDSMERRLEEQGRELKAYVDLRREESLAYFRVLRDELRSHDEKLQSHDEKLQSHDETLRSQAETLRSQAETLKEQSQTLQSIDGRLERLEQGQASGR